MAAFRYWRLSISNNDGSVSYTSINEFELRSSAADETTGQGGTATASSQDGGDGPAGAFDDNDSAEWVTASGQALPAWIAIDLGSPKEILTYAIRSQRVVTGRTPSAWVLEARNDPADAWTAVDTRSGQSVWGVFETRNFVINTALITARANTFTQRVSPGWPAGPLVARGRGQVARLDVADGGAFHLAGTVKVDGTPDIPVSRRVLLFTHDGARVVREQWSDAATGAYDFEHLASRAYFVVAFDHTHNFRAVIADRVMPEPMT